MVKDAIRVTVKFEEVDGIITFLLPKELTSHDEVMIHEEIAEDLSHRREALEGDRGENV